LALSATGPLLQAWFARRFENRSPYRLYALSNAGSLGALACYPLAMEPLLGRRAQVIAWSVLFGLFALVCAICACSVNWRAASDDRAARMVQRAATSSNGSTQPTRPVTMLLWLLFPMCATIVLQSATARLTADVAPVPFLWV